MLQKIANGIIGVLLYPAKWVQSKIDEERRLYQAFVDNRGGPVVPPKHNR